MLVYATVDDLVPKYVDPAPARAELMLERASTLVADHTMTAVYETDDAGLPVDADLVDALMRATCEQVAAWAGTGVEDGTGASNRWTNVSIGSASLGGAQSGGAGGGGSAADCLAPQPEKILRLAGLLGQAPRSYPPCEVADG